MLGTRQKTLLPDGPFYKQRGWINAATFLALIVVMSAVALVSGNTDMGVAATSRKELAGLSGPLSPGDPQKVRGGPGGRPDNCRTSDRNTARPASPPKGVRWQQILSIMVPTSPVDGPLHTEGTVWWCFAHTPMGAVLAAHVIPVELSGDSWRAVAEQQVVAGTARDKYVISKAQNATADPGGGAVGRFVGFVLESYAENAATVQLLLTDPRGGYLSTSVSVHWRDGDWKVAMYDDGSLYSSVMRAEPNGFVMWGA
jgi:hypothetical protein